MTDEQDVVRWIFELMVHHLERTDERERAIHRLEVTDQGLEIVAKNGALYRVTVMNGGGCRRCWDGKASCWHWSSF